MNKTLVLAALAWGAAAAAAHASIIPVLDTVTPFGANYEFSYSGTLAGDTGMVAGAEPSKLIIFDFRGYVPGSISSGIYAADMTATVENLSSLSPPPGQVDDPTIPNLVFTWIGAPFNAVGGPFADVDFAGLTALSTMGSVAIGSYSGRTQTNNGAATGLAAFNQGRVGVPVPEPAAWAMLIAGFGLVGAGLRVRRGPTRAFSPS